MYINRLSSFFSYEGELEIRKISAIKKHVFYIENLEEAFILKKHQKFDRLEQQWDFFEQVQNQLFVPFQKYPNGQKYLVQGNNYWTLTPFIKGRKLDYKNETDRYAAIEVLHNFHKEAKRIYISRPIKKDLFLVRWERRLSAFEKTAPFFKDKGFEMLYKDIVQTMVFHLRLAAKLPWEKEEEKARLNGEWIHGDVASHNFIQNKQTYMIDFDLLRCGSQLYDYIQLGQRFLPYINWDVGELLAYKMVSERDVKKWLTAIMIPSDVIREWLFFLSQGSSPVEQYLSQMEKDWIKRHFFLKNAKSMLKSI